MSNKRNALKAKEKSCQRCHKGGRACDGHRPCLNCLTIGLADDCADVRPSTGPFHRHGRGSKAAQATDGGVCIRPLSGDDFVTIHTGSEPSTSKARAIKPTATVHAVSPLQYAPYHSTCVQGVKRSRANQHVQSDDGDVSFAADDETDGEWSGGSQRVTKRARTATRKRVVHQPTRMSIPSMPGVPYVAISMFDGASLRGSSTVKEEDDFGGENTSVTGDMFSSLSAETQYSPSESDMSASTYSASTPLQTSSTEGAVVCSTTPSYYSNSSNLPKATDKIDWKGLFCTFTHEISSVTAPIESNGHQGGPPAETDLLSMTNLLVTSQDLGCDFFSDYGYDPSLYNPF